MAMLLPKANPTFILQLRFCFVPSYRKNRATVRLRFADPGFVFRIRGLETLFGRKLGNPVQTPGSQKSLVASLQPLKL